MPTCSCFFRIENDDDFEENWSIKELADKKVLIEQLIERMFHQKLWSPEQIDLILAVRYRDNRPDQQTTGQHYQFEPPTIPPNKPGIQQAYNQHKALIELYSATYQTNISVVVLAAYNFLINKNGLNVQNLPSAFRKLLKRYPKALLLAYSLLLFRIENDDDFEENEELARKKSTDRATY